jgi:hypothetical protein
VSATAAVNSRLTTASATRPSACESKNQMGQDCTALAPHANQGFRREERTICWESHLPYEVGCGTRGTTRRGSSAIDMGTSAAALQHQQGDTVCWDTAQHRTRWRTGRLVSVTWRLRMRAAHSAAALRTEMSASSSHCSTCSRANSSRLMGPKLKLPSVSSDSRASGLPCSSPASMTAPH